jgi:capsular exopolysaccharide synthesis family protein
MLIAAAGDVPADVPAGLVDHMDGSLREKVVVDANMLPASREQYRRLAAALHHAQAASGVKVVMIASAVANEGKTLTAANLALTLSESYRRNVLLIDADLRRPSLHTFFKVRGAPGLNEGLTAADEPKLPLHDVSPRLTILPAGMPNSDPMAGLTSRRMQSLIDEAREAFAWVIIDTPPVGLLTDANLLASMVDGAVLVVKAGSTPYDLVKRAVDTIGPSKLLGVVLNQAHGTLGKYSYQYSDYYHRAPAPAKGGAR